MKVMNTLVQEDNKQCVLHLIKTHRNNYKYYEISYDCAHSLHSLCRLSTDVDKFVHLKLVLLHVDVSEQGGAITPLSHDSQLWLAGPAHEQENICMAGFTKRET